MIVTVVVWFVDRVLPSIVSGTITAIVTARIVNRSARKHADRVVSHVTAQVSTLRSNGPLEEGGGRDTADV